jgi:YfiR/HmsC-like
MLRAPSLAMLLRILVMLVFCGFPETAQLFAQTLSDDQVKAAYLYNFAKFVEWPANKFAAATSPVRFCILEDYSLEPELARIVKGKSVGGRAIEIVQVQGGEQSRNCHILFINAVNSKRSHSLLDAVRGSAVLTVGESESFIEHGGMIAFVLIDDRVHFQVNHKAATDAGVYVSSRLLVLAKRVIE